ncbi:phosphotransferase family protein [Spongiibacter taiwanensis]|uniref:phosphotransferase family protein n=1 Tax=Spongiibacter taiwanensis TaxID=1748242 RepID=UPI0020357B65|nr:phosphotransferase family protein [Spongiibacter taiwanensis]USA41680.1 phosphotransferase family protein [Spongiibacter taiwanensis]
MSWTWTDTTLGRLRDFLETRDVLHGPITTKPIGDGHSNLTYLVSDGKRQVVVRRPPPPPLPPGAHDVLREARLLQALAGSGVPVARVLAVDSALEVLDVPFYVMDFVPGEVITERTPPALSSPDIHQAMGETLIDTLAALHRVDWRACGLADFGKPEGFNARHYRRIRSLITDDQGKVPTAFAELDQWLAADIPGESGATIIHNDFRIGNVMWAAQGPATLLAVLDWELATLGDPLMDLAYFLNCYPEQGAPRTPTQDLATAVLEPGFASPSALAQRYAEQSGRDITGLRWYRVFINWKLAVLYEYSRQRGEDAYYAEPGLVQRFLDAADRLTRG